MSLRASGRSAELLTIMRKTKNFYGAVDRKAIHGDVAGIADAVFRWEQSPS